MFLFYFIQKLNNGMKSNWLSLVFGHHLKCDQIIYFDEAIAPKKKKKKKTQRYQRIKIQEMNRIIPDWGKRKRFKLSKNEKVHKDKL